MGRDAKRAVKERNKVSAQDTLRESVWEYIRAEQRAGMRGERERRCSAPQ